MTDVHCHLNFHSFSNDYDAVIKRANAAGVNTIINTGTKIDSSKRAIELAKKYENLYAIVGIHPHHADKQDIESDWEKILENLAKQEKVVAIGEIGMDYYRYKSNGIVDKKLQKEIFEKQIMLAHRVKLPLQIHNRQAGKDVIEILRHHKNYLSPIPGMFHCFAGNKENLSSALQMGFYIGFDGNSTYPGLAPEETVELNELIKLTPIDRILTETDSPFLTPLPYRGKRNEPSYVILIGEHIARIKNLTFEEIARTTDQNAHTLFHLMTLG